jgi:Dolichyl-phosphate-mannose-protein mannosyltransferase
MTTGVLLLFCAACGVSVVLGYFCVSIFWPDNIPKAWAWAFAPPIGVGLCSITFTAFRRPMFTVEFGLLILSGWLWFRRRHAEETVESTYSAWWRSSSPLPLLLLAFTLGVVTSQWMELLERTPHGDWDATAIWNSHARYLYRDGPTWEQHIQNTFHPDYPLLVPATVARVWRYIGHDVPEAAGLLGILYGISAAAILFATLAALRGLNMAMMMTLVLSATPFFVEYAASGSADVPLSLYILATIALLALKSFRCPDSPGLLVLAGFAAGCAGWTKNEGLLFMVAVFLAMAAQFFRQAREALRSLYYFCAGMLLPIGATLWFKMAIAPPNDVIGGRHATEIFQKVLSPDRYRLILDTFLSTFQSFGNWFVNPVILILIYILLRKTDRRVLREMGWLQGVFIVGFVLTGYFAVYVVTPLDLQYHLGSSLPRLFLQLWPAGLLLVGLMSISDSADG